MQKIESNIIYLLNSLEDFKLQFSEKGIQNLNYAFRQKSEMELCMLELKYNEEEDKWEGVYYDENTGEDMRVQRPFSYEIEYTFHKRSQSIILALETIMLVYGDDSKLVTNVLQKIFMDLEETRINILSSDSSSRYHNGITALLENFESNLKKRTQHTYKIDITQKPKVKFAKAPVRLSFVFKHKGKEDLLREVYRNCEIFNESFIDPETDEDYFIQVLTTNDLSPYAKPIQLGCETKMAVYILDRLKQYFKKLDPSTVGRSCLFRTKEGAILTKDNIYYSRNSNKRKPPKDYTSIDDFFDSLKVY